jgi:predicted nuclease of predicted toxin-antitoxin system
MLSGYADEHLNYAIVTGLRRRGVDVVRVQDRGQCGMDDEILLATATAENRLMLSNDQDFLLIHHNWQAAGRSHAGIVYWHQSK